MPIIITATDYSDVATNAVHYACKMASEVEAEVVVLHSYSVPLTFSDGPLPINFVNDVQQDAEDHMTRLLDSLRETYPDIDINGDVLYGDAVDAINDYALTHEQPWMIVIGNSITGDNDTWPGTTVMNAFSALEHPVLAIPPGVVYKRPLNICFAFDNKHTGNLLPLASLAYVIEQFRASLHVLNVHAGDSDPQASIDMDTRRALAPYEPRYTMVADNDIAHAIETFVTANSADMLVMIPRKHSFFEGLFHKSHTRAAAHKANIPILALHDGD